METQHIAIEKQIIRPKTSLKKEIGLLLMKIAFVILIFIVLFTFIFGIMRVKDSTMSLSIKNRDLVLYYRLDKKIVVGDVVVVEYEGKKQVRRVVAMAGDTVNITNDGLEINGSLQYEPAITTDTLRYVDGTNFPVTLEKDQVFLLADNRKDSIDSRIYGPVNKSDILGKAMSLFRQREI